AVTVTVFAAGLLLGVTGSAGAAPAPTVSQVQAKLKSLQTQSDKLDQHYGQVKQEWVATRQRLTLLDKEIAADSLRFAGLQKAIDLIGVADYEGGNFNTSLAMLASGNASNAQGMLDKSSILEELSAADGVRIREFLAAASQLTDARLAEERTKAGIAELRTSLLKQQASLKAMENKETTLLAKLTPAEAAGVVAGVGGTTTAKDPIATTTQAGKAVAYVYDQLGCPYLYGGTGPCDVGFDCSGLMMEAWAAAGVSIPRDSYDQEADLPQVSLNDLKPGDILGFAGNSHVGMYVGGNKLIDAPHTGADVELVSLSGWYAEELDEAVRP
ncbi:MAG TPA: NlpC/P60 family protein, partial [Streptosporangiaceae bacterium]|nr:NlpC/P60 family protein [Streptosporangiaceae bacterium]